jgi:tetratricopeptide (TPR) repeat protein
MWTALAHTYQALGQEEDAMRCFQRALLSPECDALTLCRLAKLYVAAQQPDKALAYYQLYWEELCEEGSPDAEGAGPEEGGGGAGALWEEACLYLARHCWRSGSLPQAAAYLEPIAHTAEGKALARELASVRASRRI